MRNYPELYRPPIWCVTGIGRVIARWSYLQWFITEIIYKMVGTGPKQARVSLQKFRAEQFVTIFKRLAEIREITFPDDLTNGLGAELQAAEWKRNFLAHGLWLRDPDTNNPCVWHVSGAWEAGPLQGTPRALKPQAVTITCEYFQQTIREIDKVVLRLRQIALHVDEKLAAAGDQA